MSVLMAVVCMCGVCSAKIALTSNHIDYCGEGGRERKREGEREERKMKRGREIEEGERERERERKREQKQHNNLMYSFKNSPT